MDKGLFVIIVMYSVSFSILGAQYMLADVFGVELTNSQGQSIKPAILQIINTDSFNAIQQNTTATGSGSTFVNNIQVAAQAGFELFQLITGTYILSLLLFFSIPAIICYGIMGLVGILAALFIIGHIKDFV